ncbi:DUF4398 domain-containing protein [Aliiglaciecola sp.]|nr:DUF4398 domain-containing protein [Aliiglaciecola sp.]
MVLSEQAKREGNRFYFALVVTCIIFVVILIGGCAASQPSPLKSIWAAEATIARAERARVNLHAPSELNQARQILSRARLAMSKERNKDAEQMAQQSLATAQLAFIKAELRKAEKINEDLRNDIEQLNHSIKTIPDGNK